MNQREKSEQSPLPPCPNGRCSQSHVVRNGSHRGRQRYVCRTCKTYFGETQGTPMYNLKTPAAKVARALLVVMRRGSLRAAEEITGHKDETIGEWLQHAARHAQALTEVLASDPHLSQMEIDEFWSFVRKKTARPSKLTKENAGQPGARPRQSLHRRLLQRSHRPRPDCQRAEDDRTADASPPARLVQRWLAGVCGASDTHLSATPTASWQDGTAQVGGARDDLLDAKCQTP